MSRDSILNDIWGFDYDGDTRIVDVHVFKLRNKLNGSSVHIKSSRGVGYLLEENMKQNKFIVMFYFLLISALVEYFLDFDVYVMIILMSIGFGFYGCIWKTRRKPCRSKKI